jgi:hypothetical protein
MITEDLRCRIRDGAAWLDEHQEGWRDRVQVIDLQLSNACLCVLGQVFSDQAHTASLSDSDGCGRYGDSFVADESGATYYQGFWYAMYERKDIIDSERAEALAFDMDYDQEDYHWDDMTQAWRGFLKGEWT